MRLLASKPEAVVVEEKVDAEGRHVSVQVDPEDVGRLIGRGGRTVRALRTVARAAAGSRPAPERVCSRSINCCSSTVK